MEKVVCNVGDVVVELSNLQKVFWPKEGYTKGQLINYYVQVAPYILPHLAGRPMVMHRFPDGIMGKSFYQKDLPDYAPQWLHSVSLYHHDSNRTIRYCLIEDISALVWFVNQGCIELHPWLSKVGTLEYPEAIIWDLDPMPPATFEDSVTIAHLIKKVLDSFGLASYLKTSGATGLHIYLPLKQLYSYEQVRKVGFYVASLVASACPGKATIERVVSNRGGKVYIDYLQNCHGKTIASVYSIRPRPMAPVSTPLTWDEVENRALSPHDFTMENVPERLEEIGDLFKPVLENKQDLGELLELACRQK